MKKLLVLGGILVSSVTFAQCDLSNAQNAWFNVREDVDTQMDVVAPGLSGTECTLTVNSTSDNGDRARVQDRSPASESSFRGRFIVNVDALGSLAANERTKLHNVQCRTAENPSCPGVGIVQFRLQGDGNGNNILRSFVTNEDEADLRTRFDVSLVAGENNVEYQWVRASGAGVSDGVFRVWYPGNTTESSPSFEVTNLNNFGWVVDQVNLGLIQATNAWVGSKAGLNVLVDEYESRRQTAISLN